MSRPRSIVSSEPTLLPNMSAVLANGTAAPSESDMALDSESSASSAAHEEAVPISIQLSFSTGASGAWDDRELINMYDAAMDEFHKHHPGPGSWLDKATAAIAAGQPVPGVAPVHQAWYGAEQTSNPVAVAPPAARPPKRQVNGIAKSPFPVNPYDPGLASSQAGPSTSRPGRSSPTYNPPSPPAEEDEANENAQTVNGYDWNGDNWAGASEPAVPALQGVTGGPAGQAPDYGVENTAGVSAEVAMGYAMTAQYWAGYWMGVAQARSQPLPPPPIEAPAGSTGISEPSNIIVTRKQFGVLKKNLRR